MRQSLILVLLQVVNIILGFFSLFYIARNITPALLGLVGIFTVISSVISVFSSIGLETIAIRNVLDWKYQGKEKEIVKFVSNTFIFRIFISLIISIPTFVYANYVSFHNYCGTYTLFINFFVVSAIFNSINDSARLVLKSFNRYVLANLNYSIVNAAGKVLGIFVFSLYGFNSYLIVLLLLPIISLIISVYYLRNYIQFKLPDKSFILNNITEIKHFGFSAYVNYFYNYFDQLLFSIFLPTALFGSFSMAKNIWFVIKSLVENFFDPLTQNLVQYKSNSSLLISKLKHVLVVQKGVAVLYSIGILIYLIYGNIIIQYVGLDHYKYLFMYLLFVLIGQFVYLIYKLKFDLISLFFDSKTIFNMNIIFAIIGFLSSLILYFIDWEYLTSSLAIAQLIFCIVVFIVERKKSPLTD